MLEIIIHGSVSLSERFELIIKVNNDLSQGYFVLSYDPIIIEKFGTFENAPCFVAQLRNAAIVLRWSYNLYLCDGLQDVANVSICWHISAGSYDKPFSQYIVILFSNLDWAQGSRLKAKSSIIAFRLQLSAFSLLHYMLS